MSDETAGLLVKILAEEVIRSRITLASLSDLTGISLPRLKHLAEEQWQEILLDEIIAVSTALELDLANLIHAAALECGGRMVETARPEPDPS